MPSVLPFHRALLEDPAFTSAPFAVHTRWIETEFAGQLPPYAGEEPGAASAGSPGAAGQAGPWAPAGGRAGERERIVVEVGGKRLEVVLPAGLGVSAGVQGAPARGGAAVQGGGGGSGGAGAATSGRHGRRSGRGRASGRRAGDDHGDELLQQLERTIV